MKLKLKGQSLYLPFIMIFGIGTNAYCHVSPVSYSRWLDNFDTATTINPLRSEALANFILLDGAYNYDKDDLDYMRMVARTLGRIILDQSFFTALTTQINRKPITLPEKLSEQKMHDLIMGFNSPAVAATFAKDFDKFLESYWLMLPLTTQLDQYYLAATSKPREYTALEKKKIENMYKIATQNKEDVVTKFAAFLTAQAADPAKFQGDKAKLEQAIKLCSLAIGKGDYQTAAKHLINAMKNVTLIAKWLEPSTLATYLTTIKSFANQLINASSDEQLKIKGIAVLNECVVLKKFLNSPSQKKDTADGA